MKYIKDGKIYNTPIILKIDDKIIHTNNEKILKENGFEKYIHNPSKPSLDQMINESNEMINKQIDERILNDFTWNGEEFYLTMENQFNFKNLYDLRDFKEYPITIKTKSGFTTLDDISALSGFYFAGVQFIEECLKEGWQKKLDAEAEIRKNY